MSGASRKGFIIGCLLAAFAAASWGGSSVVGRVMMGHELENIDTMTVNFYRFLMGSLVLNGIVLFSGHGRDVLNAIRTDWKKLCLAGLFGVVLEGSFQLWSLNWTTAGRSSLFGSATPLFTLILAALFLRERSGLLRWIGVLVASSGTIWLFFTGGNDILGTGSDMWIGDLLAMGSAVSWALYTVTSVDVTKRHNGLICTAVMLSVGTLLLLPVTALRGGFAFPVTPGICIGLVYLGAVACGISYFCWTQAGKYLPAGVLGGFGYLNLLLALVFSLIFLEEQFTWQTLGCILLILTGSYLMVQKDETKSPATSDAV